MRLREKMDYFRDSLVTLEAKGKLKSNKILTKNIAQISSLMKLNKVEEKILEFVTLLKQYEILDDTVSLLGNEINTTQVKRALGTILGIKKEILIMLLRVTPSRVGQP